MAQNDDKRVWGTLGRGEGQGKDDFRAKVVAHHTSGAEIPGLNPASPTMILKH